LPELSVVADFPAFGPSPIITVAPGIGCAADVLAVTCPASERVVSAVVVGPMTALLARHAAANIRSRTTQESRRGSGIDADVTFAER
jgi:hypothetical protein